MQEKPAEFTRALARFIVGVQESDILESIYDHAKIAFMDWFAVTLAGKDDPLVGKLMAYADVMGGNEQATILGHHVLKSVSQATLINGSASHALDYDDTLRSFLGHPSVTLFPGLLALAEWQGKPGKDLLTAYLVGLQAGAAVGGAAGLEHYKAGWHGTSTVGYLASAAGSSRLLGLNELETTWALGIAGTQASGLKRVFGTMCKPFHAGKCSESGVVAALLARDGFTSAEDILEGPLGFFHVLQGSGNEKVLGLLGKSWDVENIAQKYHASCHATHSPIEAVLSIVEKEALKPEEIDSVSIRSSQISLDAAGRTDPANGTEAKFSIPYCVANAVLRGNTGMQAFTDERVLDTDVRDFMKKISISPEADFETLESRVTVESTSGKQYSAFSDILKEIPDLETKSRKIREKYRDLCNPVLGGKKTQELENTIEALDNLANIKHFVERLAS